MDTAIANLLSDLPTEMAEKIGICIVMRLQGFTIQSMVKREYVSALDGESDTLPSAPTIGKYLCKVGLHGRCRLFGNRRDNH